MTNTFPEIQVAYLNKRSPQEELARQKGFAEIHGEVKRRKDRYRSGIDRGYRLDGESDRDQELRMESMLDDFVPRKREYHLKITAQNDFDIEAIRKKIGTPKPRPVERRLSGGGRIVGTGRVTIFS